VPGTWARPSLLGQNNAPRLFNLPHKVVQYGEHLLNNQNQEMELFSGTKILLD